MASLQVNAFNQKGMREGLTDIVADLFADDAPVFRMAEKVKAIHTKVEWQTDALASSSNTAVVEGAALTYVQPGLRTRKSNYCHIRLRNWDVTFTQMATVVAGIKDQVAREVMKALKALVLDYEKIILNTGTTSAGSTSAGRKCMGLQKAIVTNTAVGTGAGSSANIQLTEDNVNLLMQKVWTQGGDPRVLIGGGHQKRVISKKFSAKTGFTFNVEASTRQAIANINKYEGSFGTVDIVPDREHLKKRITILTPDQVKIAVLRDITQYKGAPTASSLKGWVEAEMSLIFGNQLAHAKHSYLKFSGTIA